MSKTLKEHNYHGIDATIIADSKNEHGQRITSFVCTFPRIVLAEFNTHRMLSRNSASSRAIPFKKMLKQIEEHPFIPIKWMKDHKGMQGNEYFSNDSVDPALKYEGSPFDIFNSESKALRQQWLLAKNKALTMAIRLSNMGLTKQFVNRLLEPFKWHTAIVTATEWENFFALRAHEAAEIHIQDLAFKMLEEYNNSEPRELKAGEWHIPFGDSFDEDELVALQRHLSDLPEGGYKVGGLFTGKGGFLMFDNAMKKEIGIDPFVDLKVKIATARCARVSYENFEGGDDYEKDIKLHNRLAEMGHWSPMEHCARAMTEEEFKLHIRGTVAYDGEEDNWEEMYVPDNSILGWSGNFQGFIQYRKMFNNENKKDDRVV